MAVGRLTSTILVVGGALLCGVSLQNLREEAAPYLMGGVSAERRHASILTGEVRPADSRWSKDLFLNDCLAIPRSVFGLVQTSETKIAFAEACRDEALSITKASPVNSLAWLVIASSAGELHDLELLRDSMQQARKAAPNVQWLSARRTAVLDMYTDLSERASDPGYLADLQVMLRGGEATRELASRYLRNEELRPILTRAAELSDPERQQAFLGAIRRQAAERPS